MSNLYPIVCTILVVAFLIGLSWTRKGDREEGGSTSSNENCARISDEDADFQ